MLNVVARCLDPLFVIVAALIAHLLRFPAGGVALADSERLLTAFNCALVLLLFPGFGFYETWRGHSLPAMLGRVFVAWFAVAATSLVLVFTLHRVDAVSRLWFAYASLIAGALIVSTKCATHLALRVARRRGLNFRTVAIAGTPGFSRALLAHLGSAPHAGFRPVCLFDTGSDAGADAAALGLFDGPRGGLPVLTDFDAFAAKVRAEQVNEVWLALPLSEEHTIYRFKRAFQHDFVNLRFIPDVRSLALFGHALTDIVGLATISLNATPVSPLSMWPKLVFDRLFALAALVALAPLFCAIAAAVKITSPGPVFFRQWRKGVDGRPFMIYKFRSMVVHSEGTGRVTPAARADARLTRVGAFLRRTSLDELPQFFNVLAGQMSVVGPRPHAVEHDDLYKDLVYGYMSRYRIKPGITGWAQVNGYRGTATKIEKMETRVKFDLFYLHNWSFWFDVRIVLITVFKGFAGRNAY